MGERLTADQWDDEPGTNMLINRMRGGVTYTTDGSVMSFDQYVDGLREAIERGANLNSKTNYMGMPILNTALWCHQKSDEVGHVLDLLLERGADPNIESMQCRGNSLPNGTTPLIYNAICTGSNPFRDPVQPAVVARRLIRHGATIFHKDETGKTSLDYLLEKSGKTTFEKVWNRVRWQRDIVYPRIFDGQDVETKRAVVEEHPPGNIDSPQNALSVELVINALQQGKEEELQTLLHSNQYDDIALAHGLRDFVVHLLAGRDVDAPVRKGLGRKVSVFRG